MTAKRQLLLERIASGELQDREALVSALSEEERLELARIDEENRELLRALPASEVADEVHRRLRVEAVRATEASSRARIGGARFMRIATLAAPVAAVVVAVVLARPAIDVDPQGPGVEVTRAKGEARLSIYRQSPSGAERLSDRATVAPADVLQLRYEAGAILYGVIVSIDGAGQVTMHLPRDGSAAAVALDPAGAALPSAYELDAAPSFERFFFVTSSAPFSASVVERAASQLAASRRGDVADLDLGPGLVSTAVLLRKEK
ncbi:ActD-like protein [Myxococcota bacterium]|nr:ActD-like protein [Myxococcota bacterium]